ncbi:uncharacterized protein LOC128954895 isoform X2 [Oppia nitens]|uniref:uncharacterized protein LOC128954895 isoform X2 n=1 Tax=Oppia nitens TaxID=1686743 RepID=UPI0023DAA2B8|nr:uncharacterized protein LOC128954895 isoform X2 [Oppia nitens]
MIDFNDRDNSIVELNHQLISLRQQISDRDSELLFCRSVEQRHSHSDDIQLSAKTTSSTTTTKTTSAKSTPNGNKFKNSDKYLINYYSLMDQLNEDMYENMTDFNHNYHNTNTINNESQYYEQNEINDDIETDNDSVHSKPTQPSSPKSSSQLFPSLPDVILRKLKLLCESSCSIESLTEEEIDSKFTTLSLAFKTDKSTMTQRVDLHRHQRDVAEVDAHNELLLLRKYIQQLQQILLGDSDSDSGDNTNNSVGNYMMTTDVREAITKITSQVDVIEQTNHKISSRSEQYGAIKQEERVSHAVEVMVYHTDNVRKQCEKYRKDLEKTKNLMKTMVNKSVVDLDTDSDTESVPMRRSIRSISTTILPKMNLIRVRRASVSTSDLLPNLDKHRKSVQTPSVRPSIASVASYLANRSRRQSMPATGSIIYRNTRNNGLEGSAETSYLEITTEEKCGSESDGASESVTDYKPDSDDDNKIVENTMSLADEMNLSSINQNSRSILNDIQINESNDDNIGKDEDIEDDEDNQVVAKCDDIYYNDVNDNQQKHSKLTNIFRHLSDESVTNFVQFLPKDYRYFILILLIISTIIVVFWSLMTIGFPCDCRCDCSLSHMFSAIFPFTSASHPSNHDKVNQLL